MVARCCLSSHAVVCFEFESAHGAKVSTQKLMHTPARAHIFLWHTHARTHSKISYTADLPLTRSEGRESDTFSWERHTRCIALFLIFNACFIRFYNLIILPRIRSDIADHQRLNFWLYQVYLYICSHLLTSVQCENTCLCVCAYFVCIYACLGTCVCVYFVCLLCVCVSVCFCVRVFVF